MMHKNKKKKQLNDFKRLQWWETNTKRWKYSSCNEAQEKNTHIFSTHGFKHFFQLNPQLLDVINQDAGLIRNDRKIIK